MWRQSSGAWPGRMGHKWWHRLQSHSETFPSNKASGRSESSDRRQVTPPNAGVTLNNGEDASLAWHDGIAARRRGANAARMADKLVRGH